MKFCEGICPACRGYGEHFDSCSVADDVAVEASTAMSQGVPTIEAWPGPDASPALTSTLALVRAAAGSAA